MAVEDRDLTRAVVPITALATIAGATWWLANSLNAVDIQLQSLRYEVQQIKDLNQRNLTRDEFRAWAYKLAYDNPAIKVSEFK